MSYITLVLTEEQVEDVIASLHAKHGEFCISSDKCNCYELSDKLEKELVKNEHRKQRMIFKPQEDV